MSALERGHIRGRSVMDVSNSVLMKVVTKLWRASDPGSHISKLQSRIWTQICLDFQPVSTPQSPKSTTHSELWAFQCITAQHTSLQSTV